MHAARHSRSLETSAGFIVDVTDLIIISLPFVRIKRTRFYYISLYNIVIRGCKFVPLTLVYVAVDIVFNLHGPFIVILSLPFNLTKKLITFSTLHF